MKLYVEEMNNPNSDLTSKRAYKLINIEKASTASARVQISPSSVTNTANANISVSDLFALVKQKDKDFQPNPVNKALLNNNGTPMILFITRQTTVLRCLIRNIKVQGAVIMGPHMVCL